MGIKADLETAVKDAMRSHDEDRKRVYRLALAAINFSEKNLGKALDEDEVTAIIQKEIKIRNETLVEAKKADRTKMAAEVENEIVLLESFLPQQLTDEELRGLVHDAIRELNAQSIADMGKVMKSVLQQAKGRAPNDQVSKLVKELLLKNE